MPRRPPYALRRHHRPRYPRAWLADPVPGVGIAVPVFIPTIVTAVVALLLSRSDAAPLAYISGSLGTLIGADLTNLDKVARARRPSRLNRRSRHLRWHFSHRHRGRSASWSLSPPPAGGTALGLIVQLSVRIAAAEPRHIGPKDIRSSRWLQNGIAYIQDFDR